MITHLLFFTLVLLLAGLAPTETVKPPESLPFTIFLLISSYICLLGLLFLQNKYLNRFQSKLYLLSQVEIFIFLLIYYFFFDASSIFAIFRSQTLSALMPIILYLFATGFYYCTSFWPLKRSYPYAKRQIKMLIPFALPFVIFTLLTDLSQLFGMDPFKNLWLSVLFLALSAVFLAVCFPPLICQLWECKPLQEGEIKFRLETICKRAKFSHGGLKNWNLLEFTPTAAILGVLPNFRYVLFTPSLLKNLSSNALEAVLAHEIGHSKYKHLLFFPFLLLGMIIFVLFILDGFFYIFPNFNKVWAIFILTAILIALYFRLILGFFSRLFEREADIYGLQIGVPVQATIEALDTIGNLTGKSHKIPNWHHFSIEQRIQFLKNVEKNPRLAARYHRYVRLVQIFFFLLLIVATKFLF